MAKTDAVKILKCAILNPLHLLSFNKLKLEKALTYLIAFPKLKLNTEPSSPLSHVLKHKPLVILL